MHPRDERLRGVSWRATSAQEQAILKRVEQHLEARPWWPQQATAIPQPTGYPYKWGLAWALALCLSLGLGLGLFFWQSSQPHTRPQGQIAAHPPASTKHQSFAIPLRQTRTLQRHQRWQLTAESDTRFDLQESEPRKAIITLHQGRIHVHVTPGSMRLFEVRWNGHARLLVKGTRFTVEQRSHWMRLEVQRGAVSLVTASQPAVLIRAKQGIRITQQRPKQYRYTLPQHPPKTLSQRLKWLRQQDPESACIHALDWSEQPHLSKHQRRDLLEQSAYTLAPKRLFGCITQLWLRVHALHISATSDETALAAAAQSCRQQHHDKTLCVTLYQRYLRNYQHGILREHVLYWLLHALSQQTSMQRKQTQKLLKQYQKMFPQGQYRRRIKQIGKQLNPQHRTPTP